MRATQARNGIYNANPVPRNHMTSFPTHLFGCHVAKHWCLSICKRQRRSPQMMMCHELEQQRRTNSWKRKTWHAIAVWQTHSILDVLDVSDEKKIFAWKGMSWETVCRHIQSSSCVLPFCIFCSLQPLSTLFPSHHHHSPPIQSPSKVSK